MDGRYEQTTIERLKRGWVSRVASLVLSFLLPLTTMPTMAWALPHGGMVTKGVATLSYSTSKLLVTQSTSSASYSWQSFNVGSSQAVTYRTPGAKSVSMNYIGGTTPALISGKVTSNGILYFMDANGIVFGQGSEISAAGVRAYGAASPTAPPSGAVTNAGTLSVAPGGEVVLVGTSVGNSGTITAPGGEVVMASGKMVTLSQTSGSSFSVMTSGGGSVDDSGVVSAETVGGRTGQIVLQSGMDSGTTTLESTAVLDASAPNGGNGGQIVINASGVVLDNTEPINVSAPYGTKGTVRVDPNYILSGTTLDICNAAGLEYLDGNQSSYLSDTINLEANMNLGGSYSWTPLGNSSSSFTGTFNGNGYAMGGYTIGTLGNKYSGNDVGFIGYLGSGGKVENLGVSGTIYASGDYVGGVVGFNNGGTVETSYNTGSVNGAFYVGGVVGFNNGGTVETSYNTGSVSGSSYVGGVVGWVCSGNVETSFNTGSVGGNYFVGGVAGVNFATVETSYNTGSVSGSNDVGGVAGYNSGTVETSYNTGSVSGSDNVGGVVGFNSSTVTISYNTGSVSGSSEVGGVVGFNFGTVTGTYYNSLVFTGSGIGNANTGSATGLAEGTGSNDLGNSGSYSSSWSFASGWSSGAGFSTSGTGFSTPGTWIIGTVYPNNASIGILAPILVPDLATATVTGNSGSSVYNGSTVSPGYTTTFTMGGTTIFPLTVAAQSVSADVGIYTVSLSATGTISTPTTQTSVDSVSGVSGKWTITPAPLGLCTTFSKPFDGTSSAVLTASNTSLTGVVAGQTGSLSSGVSLSGTFSSSNAGQNLGGTVSVSSGDLTGTFSSALNKGDYTLPSTFLGGSITPATLVETAKTSTMTYGGTVPTLSGTLSSPTISSTEIANLVTASWSTSATKTSNVGAYSIVPTLSYGSGVVSGDFSPSPASGNSSALTVNPAPLTVTLSSVDKTYDGSSTAYIVGAATSETANGLTQSISPNVTLSGFVNADSGAFVAATGSYLSGGNPVANVGRGYTVSVPVSLASFSAGSGTLLSNYSVNGVRLTGSNSATLTGTGSIAPATLSLTTTAEKTYDGSAGIYLTPSDTTVLGTPVGQAGSLGKSLSATLSSSSEGSDLGGTVSVSPADLTGNLAFLSALSAGDYLVSPNFTGGGILSLSSSAIVPAAQTSSANISQLSAPTGLNGVAFQAGSPATSLPTLAFLPSGSFGSAPTGGLNMGDLTEDTATIFDVNSVNVSFPSTSGDETILAVGLRDIQPVDTISLKENTQIASPSSLISGGHKNEVSGGTTHGNARTLDLLTLTGSRGDSYSLRIPAFRAPSDNGIFESQEER